MPNLPLLIGNAAAAQVMQMHKASCLDMTAACVVHCVISGVQTDISRQTPCKHISTKIDRWMNMQTTMRQAPEARQTGRQTARHQTGTQTDRPTDRHRGQMPHAQLPVHHSMPSCHVIHHWDRTQDKQTPHSQSDQSRVWVSAAF